jgi:hypothetical protein
MPRLKTNRIPLLIFAVALVMSLAACNRGATSDAQSSAPPANDPPNNVYVPPEQEVSATSDPANEQIDYSDTQIGDIINFGGYDWLVMDVQNGKALIITEQVIEDRTYHNELLAVHGENCDLRSYLNGEFYNSFSTEEQARIKQVTNANHGNPWYGADSGSETTDSIFLLSIDEVVKYFGDSGQFVNRPGANHPIIDDEFNENRVARHIGGSFSSNGETYTVKEGASSWWWLRSPGLSNEYTAVVRDDGVLGVRGLAVHSLRINGSVNDRGIRPVLWLDLD